MSLTALRTAQSQAGAQFHPDGYPLRFGQGIPVLETNEPRE